MFEHYFYVVQILHKLRTFYQLVQLIFSQPDFNLANRVSSLESTVTLHQSQAYSEYKHVLANIARLRYNSPAVWTKWNGARSRRAGASILSPVRELFTARSTCGIAKRITTGLCHAFPQCYHSNATRAPIANPPNSAQLGGIPYHSAKLHPVPCNSVGMRPRSDTQTRVTTIHFSWSTTHAKCNNRKPCTFHRRPR